MLHKAQTIRAKLPKVRDLVPDQLQLNKSACKQIEPGCDRGNIEIIPQTGTTFCQEYWNCPSASHTAIYQDPPSFKPEVFITKDTPEYREIESVSHKLNKLLRHGIGKAWVRGGRGGGHPALSYNEGGWVNIDEVLQNGYIFGDNRGQEYHRAQQSGGWKN